MKIYNNPKLLQIIDNEFLQFLKAHNTSIYDVLIEFRQDPDSSKLSYSTFIIEIAPYLDDFIADKFSIVKENDNLKSNSNSHNIIFDARRKFVERYAIHHYPPSEISSSIFQEISCQLTSKIGVITEHSIAANCLRWLQNKEKYANEIAIAAKYCSLMVKKCSSLSLFNIPRKIDGDNHIRQHRIKQLKERVALGFDFRDSESKIDCAQTHANYCLYCHEQHKDTCSTGLAEDNVGCPLDQKISEMNQTRSHGYNIAALAIITIDNPLVALTGHRICNDCAKACIFQKQDPVNIPLVETNILESVLSLPYGVEIYYLLTQWNPLKLHSFLPKQETGYNILVTGLGPAGIAASYYFTSEGHNVTAIDGLKILDCDINIAEPIKYWSAINNSLSERPSAGFGGVAEYGITNRWNKNFLLLARIILERNAKFSFYGGIRLGSNLTVVQSFTYGFDHIALCLGAGKPKYLSKSGFFLKQVKSSADFLMQLQQTTAFHKNTTSALQIRLPAYVYGCGLTAIDSAVELINYYPKMVENFAARYNTKIESELSDEEKEIAAEYLMHAKIFAQCKSATEIIDSINSLGGVSIIYRKKLQESPAYVRNHEEIEHALASGVCFIEEKTIQDIQSDNYGAINSITLSDDTSLAAKTLLLGLGTGTSDFTDITDSFDDLDDAVNSRFFKKHDQKISYFGDCNPKYHGSVVKAITSVKDGHQYISEALAKQKPIGLNSDALKKDLLSTILDNQTISDNYTKLTVSSPLAAKNYQAGQFFRLQNISSDIAQIMEPLALSPYKIDKEKGELSFLIKDVGKSSNIASHLKPKTRISLMGPAGDIVINNFNKYDKTKVLILCQDIGTAISIPLIEELIHAGHEVLVVSDIVPELAETIDLHTIVDIHTPLANETINDLIVSMYYDGKLNDVNIICCYGNDQFEQQVQSYTEKYFQPGVTTISMINVPMQCMMKGICGQCVQKVDDERGYIFACDQRAQDTTQIDFSSLNKRHKMNSLLEKII